MVFCESTDPPDCCSAPGLRLRKGSGSRGRSEHGRRRVEEPWGGPWRQARSRAFASGGQTPNFREHRAMSATGRRKHTQLLLRSMHEGFQQGEEAPNVRSPPRSALPPSCSGPGVGARSAWHLTAGALAGRSDRARAVRGGCEHKEGGAGDQGVAACLPELGPPRSRRARRHGPEPAQGGRHVLHRLVTPRGRRLVTIVLFEQHYAVFGLCAAVLTNR